MNWLKKIMGAIGAYFRSGSAAFDAHKALEYVGKALPFVVVATDIAVGITPTKLDDAAWASLKASFPTLFNGQPHAPEELKLAALGAATHLMQRAYPGLSTSIARAAVQLAYIDYRALPVPEPAK